MLLLLLLSTQEVVTCCWDSYVSAWSSLPKFVTKGQYYT
jgi:hypothetical protein